jgi:hypothetical protein
LVHDDEAERDYSDQQSANDHAKKRVAPAAAIVVCHRLSPSEPQPDQRRAGVDGSATYIAALSKSVRRIMFRRLRGAPITTM